MKTHGGATQRKEHYEYAWMKKNIKSNHNICSGGAFTITQHTILAGPSPSDNLKPTVTRVSLPVH